MVSEDAGGTGGFRFAARPPRWMTRFERGVLVVTALLFAAAVWCVIEFGRWTPLLGRVSLRASVRPASDFVSVPPIAPFLLACVVATIWLQRRSERRLEPAVLVGTWLVVLGRCFQVQGVRGLGRTSAEATIPPVVFDLGASCAWLGCALALVGLLRVLADRARTGAVLALCAATAGAFGNLWVHVFLVAPDWAQPATWRATVEPALVPGVVPIWARQPEGAGSSVVVELDAGGRALVGGEVLSAEELDAWLADYAERSDRSWREGPDGPVEVLRWPLVVRPDGACPSGRVVELLDGAFEHGLYRFTLHVLVAEPAVEGALTVYGPLSLFEPLDRGELLELASANQAPGDPRPVFSRGWRKTVDPDEVLAPAAFGPSLYLFEAPLVCLAVSPDLPWEVTARALERLGASWWAAHVRVVFLASL